MEWLLFLQKVALGFAGSKKSIMRRAALQGESGKVVAAPGGNEPVASATEKAVLTATSRGCTDCAASGDAARRLRFRLVNAGVIVAGFA